MYNPIILSYYESSLLNLTCKDLSEKDSFFLRCYNKIKESLRLPGLSYRDINLLSSSINTITNNLYYSLKGYITRYAETYNGLDKYYLHTTFQSNTLESKALLGIKEVDFKPSSIISCSIQEFFNKNITPILTIYKLYKAGYIGKRDFKRFIFNKNTNHENLLNRYPLGMRRSLITAKIYFS